MEAIIKLVQYIFYAVPARSDELVKHIFRAGYEITPSAMELLHHPSFVMPGKVVCVRTAILSRDTFGCREDDSLTHGEFISKDRLALWNLDNRCSLPEGRGISQLSVWAAPFICLVHEPDDDVIRIAHEPFLGMTFAIGRSPHTDKPQLRAELVSPARAVPPDMGYFFGLAE